MKDADRKGQCKAMCQNAFAACILYYLVFATLLHVWLIIMFSVRVKSSEAHERDSPRSYRTGTRWTSNDLECTRLLRVHFQVIYPVAITRTFVFSFCCGCLFYTPYSPFGVMRLVVFGSQHYIIWLLLFTRLELMVRIVFTFQDSQFLWFCALAGRTIMCYNQNIANFLRDASSKTMVFI